MLTVDRESLLLTGCKSARREITAGGASRTLATTASRSPCRPACKAIHARFRLILGRHFTGSMCPTPALTASRPAPSSLHATRH